MFKFILETEDYSEILKIRQILEGVEYTVGIGNVYTVHSDNSKIKQAISECIVTLL